MSEVPEIIETLACKSLPVSVDLRPMELKASITDGEVQIAFTWYDQTQTCSAPPLPLPLHVVIPVPFHFGDAFPSCLTMIYSDEVHKPIPNCVGIRLASLEPLEAEIVGTTIMIGAINIAVVVP